MSPSRRRLLRPVSCRSTSSWSSPSSCPGVSVPRGRAKSPAVCAFGWHAVGREFVATDTRCYVRSGVRGVTDARPHGRRPLSPPTSSEVRLGRSPALCAVRQLSRGARPDPQQTDPAPDRTASLGGAAARVREGGGLAGGLAGGAGHGRPRPWRRRGRHGGGGVPQRGVPRPDHLDHRSPDHLAGRDQHPVPGRARPPARRGR